jgi:hypothetical protein
MPQPTAGNNLVRMKMYVTIQHILFFHYFQSVSVIQGSIENVEKDFISASGYSFFPNFKD